ncbi:MAG: hypothetical protein DI598_13040 [Pseudopedobacter saltans]|uniref:Four helix bundle protein n=1 Tax=Pseudopedobacter saltans TaxID=151895 RepID=A0A2W5GQQ9_9SPHI|nr:MAG: hypothetical protein DI598_13040 [Pseudopedobacter saltans]
MNFNVIALKSANETKYWLCLIRDAVILNNKREEINTLLNETDEVSKIIATIILNAKK